MWKPSEELAQLQAHERVWVSGMLQRRLWEGPVSPGRAGSVQVVARQISRRPIAHGLPAEPSTEPHPVS